MAAHETVIGLQRPPAKLIVEEGSMAGTDFPMTKHQIVIGRDEGMVDFVLQDPLASRRHTRLSWKAIEFIIEDLDSSNGTLLNGELITKPHLLKAGDRIAIGQSILLFQVGAEAEEKPQPEPAVQEPVAAPQIIKKPQLKEQDMIPARLILTTASQANKRLGHENLGSLSESHGFLPTKPLSLQLPSGYEVWDEMAENLPELFQTLTVRQALEAMPILSAAEADLPDEHVLRASVILSMLAHSYHRIAADPPEKPMPDGVQLPWEQITRRLDRTAPHLSYVDLIINNWRLVDPQRDDPMRVDNLRLLVPTVDNKEERIFYLTQVEAHAQAAPLTGAIVRAQEAAHHNDVDALKRELILITDGLQHVAHKTFMTINPNPHSDSFADPVVWAKTVAPFAVPIAQGTAGPSGTAAPVFHMLDMFFSRHHYDSRFGGEMLHLREWYPKHWRDFLEALGEISVAEYVQKCGDPILSGIYKEAAQNYAGHSGFLSRHKVKAYGYLDIGFKVGRSVTITGFTGLFKDRTWDAVDLELVDSHEERRNDFPQASHHADVKSVDITNVEGDTTKWVKRVVLDVSTTGLRYLPGDRCAILPENSDNLIDKTLAALKAKGYEKITLNAEWREAVNLRHGYEGATTLPLRTLLKFGRIRPVERPSAKTLYAISLNGKLRRIIEARSEDQWELWDLLEILDTAGFDPKRLWKAHPGEREHICRVVPPESFRMYSISSTMDHSSINGASELTLTIGRLLYDTRDTDVSAKGERFGTSSHYLGDTSFVAADERQKVALKLVHPPRFNLPTDPDTPIVMFAGGTGIAPFRGFILERAQQENAGDSWLFLGTRTRAEFYYQEEFEPIVAKGHLHIRPAFSRDPVDVRFVQNGDGGQFVFEPGENRYIGDEMLREENAKVLWDLLRSKKDGGQGAYFYICGRTGFANSVMDAIKGVLQRYSEGTKEEKQQKANKTLYRLVGEERYMQDIFTTYTGSHIDQEQTHFASEIVLHNNDEDGYWMVLDGRVYDLTEFGQLHAGGFKLILGYAGMDATIAYRQVLHHVNPEVHSMLGMYETGVVRRLDFGMEWGVVVGPDGLRFMSLADVYRVWIRFLYNVVEMENALYNDYSLKEEVMTQNDTAESYPPIKLQFLLEVHDRFMINYVEGTMGQVLENLWAVTSGICSQNQDMRRIGDTVDKIRQTQEADTVNRLSDELQKRIDDIIERNAGDSDPGVKLAKAYYDMLEIEDKRFLHEVKMALRAGVQVFEKFERDTVRLGSKPLLEVVQQIPRVLETYHARVLSRALSILLAHAE
jgi:sulfite reductase (NADPH) flavoprotein alpha-component